jgi:hypothetical protein
VVTVPTGQGITASDIKLFWNGYEQPALVENPVGSGKFESVFNGRYRQGGVDKIFYGAFVNGPNFFEAVVTKGGQENRAARRVVFNLYGQNLHDSDGDGLPDDIELPNFLSGRNPGPNRPPKEIPINSCPMGDTQFGKAEVSCPLAVRSNAPASEPSIHGFGPRTRRKSRAAPTVQTTRMARPWGSTV